MGYPLAGARPRVPKGRRVAIEESTNRWSSWGAESRCGRGRSPRIQPTNALLSERATPSPDQPSRFQWAGSACPSCKDARPTMNAI